MGRGQGKNNRITSGSTKPRNSTTPKNSTTPTAKAYNPKIEDVQEFMVGMCAGWAIAHQNKHPQLKFGFHHEILTGWEAEKNIIEDYGEDEYTEGQEYHRIQHVFTYDEKYAYDASGKHPLPYDDWNYTTLEHDANDVYDTGMVEAEFEAEEMLEENDPLTDISEKPIEYY